MSDNAQNDFIQKMIIQGKADPSTLVQREVEEAIELLHADLRSIFRQIKQRRMKVEFAEEFNKPNEEEKNKFYDWLGGVEKVSNNKFDQIRILERVLGDIRSNNVGDLTKAHFHVRILKEIALKVDQALANMESDKLTSFKKEDIDALRDSVDDLYGVWRELFPE